MKPAEARRKLIEELKKMPIIQVACARAGVARATFYRWRKERPKFKAAADAAITEGEAFLCDMSESQLVTLIRDKHYAAIALYLKMHHPKYANRLELTGHVGVELAPLTPAQQALVERALTLIHQPKEDNHEQ